ncbi:alpha/beta hydrolase [Poriferisphaera corsica]|nr:alpha/beta hydrolase [Poriferisphaera corsica]
MATQTPFTSILKTTLGAAMMLAACTITTTPTHALSKYANDRIKEVASHTSYYAANADKRYTYATRPERDLEVFVWTPRTAPREDAPVIVMYHGGGWNGGTPSAFARSALYFALSGYYVVTPNYRVKNTDGTTPIDAVHDAEAALQWVIDNQGVDGMDWDNQRIALYGSSAGSHLAMTTGLGGRVAGLNNGDANVFAYAAFNSVYDGSPNGYGKGRLGNTIEEYGPYSPLHLAHKDMDPIIFTHGEKDTTVPYSKALEFDQRLEDLGVEKEFLSYANYGHNTGPYYSSSEGGQTAWMQGVYNVEDFLGKQLTAIPEPSSLALLSMTMLTLIRRKK